MQLGGSLKAVPQDLECIINRLWPSNTSRVPKSFCTWRRRKRCCGYSHIPKSWWAAELGQIKGFFLLFFLQSFGPLPNPSKILDFLLLSNTWLKSTALSVDGFMAPINRCMTVYLHIHHVDNFNINTSVVILIINSARSHTFQQGGKWISTWTWSWTA